MQRYDKHLRTCRLVPGLALVLLALAGTARAGGLHGTVFAQDKDGKDLGIAAGAVLQFKDQSGAVAATATADAKGYYRAPLTPGRYFYKIQADGFQDEDSGRGFDLPAADGFAVRNFVLTRGANDPNRHKPDVPAEQIGLLAGRVYTKDRAGKMVGVPGAVIRLRREAARDLAQVVSRQADARGSRLAKDGLGGYEIKLAVGTWRAAVSAKGYQTLVDANPIRIAADGIAERDFYLVREQPAPTADQGIRGRVAAFDAKGNRLKLPADLKLYAVPLRTPAVPAIGVHATSDGNFQRRLPAGRYTVGAAAEGFRLLRKPTAHVLSGTYSYVKLALIRKAPETTPEPSRQLIAVRVFRNDAGGKQAAAGADVVLRFGEDTRHGTADGKGEAVFRIEQPGTYVAIAGLKGYRPAQQELVARASATNVIELLLAKLEPTPTPTPTPTKREFIAFVQSEVNGRKLPVPGAEVIVRQSGQPLSAAMRKRTDKEGRAIFDLSGTGGYAALARADGYRPTGERFDVLKENTAVRRFFLLAKQETPTDPPPNRIPDPTPTPTPPATKTYASYVVYRDGGRVIGVPGAQLAFHRATDLSGRPAADFRRTATSAGKGYFSLELLEGAYTVTVKAPRGFEDTALKLAVRRDTRPEYIYLTRSAAPTPEPPPTPTPTPTPQDVLVQGYVVERAANSRTGYAGLEGFRLNWSGRDRRARETQVSGQLGRFALRLAPGLYDVEVQPARPGYRTLRETVRVEPGMKGRYFIMQRERLPDPPPQPTTALLAVKVLGRNPRGAYPLPGASVTVLRSGRRVGAATAGNDGTATFRLPAGTYDVVATRDRFDTGRGRATVAASGGATTVVLNKQQAPIPGGDIPTVPTVPNSLLVVQVVGKSHAGARPLAGAVVTVVQNGRRVTASTVDRGGSASFRLKSGTYDVMASAPGFTGNGAQRVNLTGNGAKIAVMLVQPAGGGTTPGNGGNGGVRAPATHLLTIVVTGNRNARVAGAKIAISGAKKASLQTDGGGVARVQLPAGRYTLQVSSPGYAMQSIAINVTRPMTQQVALKVNLF